jgi:hypothetical protein
MVVRVPCRLGGNVHSFANDNLRDNVCRPVLYITLLRWCKGALIFRLRFSTSHTFSLLQFYFASILPWAIFVPHGVTCTLRAHLEFGHFRLEPLRLRACPKPRSDWDPSISVQPDVANQHPISHCWDLHIAVHTFSYLRL